MSNSFSGKDLVLSQRTRLRPGLFINTGGDVWHHWLQRLPEHVRRSKGPGQLSRLARIRHLLFPRLLWAHGGNLVHGYPIAIGNKFGECVLLNPQARKFSRVFVSTALLAEQIELRRRWARHIPSSHFEVTENGYVLNEDYLHGRHIHELPLADQLAMVRSVVLAYAEHTKAERAGSCAREVARIHRLCKEKRLPSQLCLHLTTPDVLDAAQAWPMVPYGSDNSPGNVIFLGEKETLRPVFLDAFPIKWGPFFSHVVGIAAGWGVPALRHAYLSGLFDPELRSLFAAAGSEFFSTLSFRQTMLAFAVALNFGSLASDENISAVHWYTSALSLAHRDGWLPR